MKILDVTYHNHTVSEALNIISKYLNSIDKCSIFFLNADCLRQAQKDTQYREILNCSDLVLSDGIGLRMATRLFGGKMIDNCNGTDLSPLIMKEAADRGYKIFFLGGIEGIADKAAQNMRKKIPGIKIVGTHSGYFTSDEDVVKQINQSEANILFVALGAPIQEKWIFKNRNKLQPKVCLGVGALLDYLSGTIPRAPMWMRQMHIEWFWRIFIDPRRMFKRYFIDGVGFLIWLIYFRIFKSNTLLRKHKS